MAFGRFRETTSRHGWHAAVVQYGYLALARVKVARVLQVLALDQDDIVAVSPEKTRGLAVRPLSATELERHAENERLEMSPAFVRQALEDDCVCVGVDVDGVLAAYTWYGRRNVELFGDLVVAVGDEVAYLYKAFTLPEYRGRHCLTANIHYAMSEVVLPDTRFLLCLVDASNLVSLSAFARNGFRSVGRVCVSGRPPAQRCWYLGGARRDNGLQITNRNTVR